MSNKVKMKCASCHKPFKSSKPSQTLCEDCEKKKRLEKAAQGTGPAKAPTTSTTAPGAKPNWLQTAVERDPTTVPPAPPMPLPPRARPPQPPRPASPVPVTMPPAGRVDRPSTTAKPTRTPRPAAPPQPPKEKKEPPKPYDPSPEEIALIEARYLDLAQPEFDGIRTQIANEMSIPKSAVKRVVATFRAREHLPSWWDMQTFNGSPEDLERIRAVYQPYLPIPPIGVHRTIAEQLTLTPIVVYRGIRMIRQTMGLPVFNPAEAHPEMPPRTKQSMPRDAATDGNPAPEDAASPPAAQAAETPASAS